MKRLAEKHKGDGLVILGVNFWDEPKDEVAEFVQEHGLKYPILLDGREVGKRYGVFAIPTTVWINPQGVVVDAAIGFEGPEHFEQKTERLLNPSG